MKLALITTTINIPKLLTDYKKQAEGHDVQFIVAGDLKTPLEARTFCEGLGVEYLGQKEQEAFLEPYSELRDYLPWNSVQRRNVAILKAYKDGADVIITIDDDNWNEESDYFGRFDFEDGGFINSLQSDRDNDVNKWVNPCPLFLNDTRGNYFYPRGFPFKERGFGNSASYEYVEKGNIVVQAGMWSGDPDIDAVTRLSNPINAQRNFKVDLIQLAPGTWCPFNSQNTALHRKIIPSYFLSPHIGRYDDIWASYIVQRLTMENDDMITFGRPLVSQKRNEHNLFHDLDLERFGMEHTDDFCEQLRAATITKKGYKDGCLELLDQIKGSQYEEFIRGYRIWLSLF